jgi:hypothetical protein
MSTVTLERRARLTGASGDGFTVPKDIAEILGEDVRVEIGPGPVVTLRPGQMTQAELVRGVTPITSIEQLRPSPNIRLTDVERQALLDFLES